MLNGNWSKTIDSIANVSTSVLLAFLLAAMIYFQWQNDREWNDRLAGIMERQAAAAEQHVAQSQKLVTILEEILRERNAASSNRN